MGIFKLFFITFFSIGFCLAGSNNSASWYRGGQKGWLWYKQSKVPRVMDKAIPQNTNSSEPSYIHTKRLEQSRKDFEEVLAKAVLNPTLENVQSMQEAQNVLMNRASYFEKMWVLASLLDGQLLLSDQQNPQHRKLYQEQRDRQLDQKIRKLAKHFGLFFLFKEDCPYCHQFAPIVRNFIEVYGFETKAISPEGKGIPMFLEVERDNGTIGVLNPEGVFPSLFLVNPQSRQVIPLARGLVNYSQLRENLKVVIQFLEESSHGR